MLAKEAIAENMLKRFQPTVWGGRVFGEGNVSLVLQARS